MGAFTQDFEYEENYGDLDECNGRIGVTREFPDGIYYYVVTDDFPFFSRCLKGDFANGSGTGGGVPNCEDVPPGMPCCGDGICGGPETEDNCPLDCASNNLAPSLINFEFYGDTINTNQESVNIGFLIEAEDNDSFLSTYTIRLNINGGSINGGETIETTGDFDSGLNTASSYGSIQIPIGSTEGIWNIRVLIEDVLGLINNFGPNDLNGLNFQNNIYVDNTYLNLKNRGTPVQFSLSQNYPNPFNPNTVINYFLPKDAYVEVSVYDILGNRIKELVNQNQKFGTKVVTWDAKNNRGLLVPAGVYLLTVEVDNIKQIKKMILLK